MKLASLIVALTLSLFAGSGTSARPAAESTAGAALAASPISTPVAAVAGAQLGEAAKDDEPSFGASTYVMLAIGLFGMGLVSRRRQPD